MAFDHPGIFSAWDDAFLLGGARTPFTDLNGALSSVSPIDLGVKAARAALQKTGVAPEEIGTTIAGSMAQASFDAYMIARHIGLYAGVPEQAPAIWCSAFAAPESRFLRKLATPSRIRKSTPRSASARNR
jgi:acetyl-CoA acetyltransferase